MMYRIEYTEDDSFPRLGWIASIDAEKKTVNVIHGKYVECRDGWAVEGVWDGEFQEGNFHQTEVFFGSGIRLDRGKIYFVASCALTDKIMYCKVRNNLIFSNSLLLLLGFTGARMDWAHDYRDEAISVNLKGVEEYDKRFRVVHPEISYFYQVLYENVVFRNGEIHFEFKPRKELKIDSYNTYYHLLLETVKKLKDNYKSDKRTITVQPFTTVSSGYDSTAVSAIVKKIGVKECFCGNRLDGILRRSEEEHGRKVAQKLGFIIHELDTKRSSISEDELYFLATNYPKFSGSVWSEISLHSMVVTIEKLNQAALVFTGYKGGSVWNVNLNEAYQEGVLKGYGAISGMNLMEIRLKTGFFNVAIPYLYIHHIRDIVSISKSEEMKDWRLGTNYDRPIARRMVEEAGVDRHLFGMQKRHITTTYLWPLNKNNRIVFYRYLKRYMNIGRFYSLIYYFQKRILVSICGMSMLFGKNIDFYDLMRKWATDVLAEKYADVLKKYDT